MLQKKTDKLNYKNGSGKGEREMEREGVRERGSGEGHGERVRTPIGTCSSGYRHTRLNCTFLVHLDCMSSENKKTSLICSKRRTEKARSGI